MKETKDPKTHTCRDCSNEFTWQQPGRPPVRCETCRTRVKEQKETVARVKTTLTTIERIDRLEHLLKSRNLHISQHEK